MRRPELQPRTHLHCSLARSVSVLLTSFRHTDRRLPSSAAAAAAVWIRGERERVLSFYSLFHFHSVPIQFQPAVLTD